jgi:hypothetical protein
MNIEGVEVEDFDAIKIHIFQYYKHLLGFKGFTWLTFSSDIW